MVVFAGESLPVDWQYETRQLKYALHFVAQTVEYYLSSLTNGFLVCSWAEEELERLIAEGLFPRCDVQVHSILRHAAGKLGYDNEKLEEFFTKTAWTLETKLKRSAYEIFKMAVS